MRLEHVPGLLWNMGRALRDSADVPSLLAGEELSSVDRMEALVAVLEATEEGRDLLRDRPRLTSSTVDVEEMRRLPAGTLGRAWAAHLDDNGLDVDGLSTPVTRGRTEVANWLLERVRQTHDVWHTVLGLDTQPHAEVLAHTFQWPQLQMPYSWLVVAFGTPKHFLLEGRLAALPALRDAWRAGRRAEPLIRVYWERYWTEDLDALRARLGVLPASAWPGLRGYVRG